MFWTVCFVLALTALVAAVILAIVFSGAGYRAKKIITPFNIILVFTAVAAFVILLPLRFTLVDGEPLPIVKSILFALHSTFQVFTVDSSVDDIVTAFEQAGGIAPAYSALMSVIFVLAPILTFGLLISFLKNVSAYIKLIFNRGKPFYAFSELNEASVTLASDIRKNHKNALLVFASAYDEDKTDLLYKAKALGGCCFKNGITEIDFALHSFSKDTYFFAIADDESQNVFSSLELIKKYGDKPKSSLYVFAEGIESELLLSHRKGLNMRVRRINRVRSVVCDYLYNCGTELFETALPVGEGKKLIHAVVVGLGKYGRMITKTLAWFCQMDGYDIVIDAFDKSETALEEFSAECPELLDPSYNGVFLDGEPNYTINIYAGIAVGSNSFVKKISALENVTCAFVALGSDSENVKASVLLRTVFERVGTEKLNNKDEIPAMYRPLIKAIINSPDAKEAFKDVTNFKGQKYLIDCIGDLASAYSEKVIISSELENFALNRHLKYGDEADFWDYEYNYRSSVASAMHLRLRQSLNKDLAYVSGIDMTPEQKIAVESLEHKRWEAYMRSEGYVCGKIRNDLAKVHHDLVPYDKLDPSDKAKDSKVGTV